MSADLGPLHQRPAAAPWRRFVARLVDAATVLTLLWVLVVLRVLWFVPGLTDRFQPDPWGRAFVVTIAFVVLAAIYEAVFVSGSAGQTPGKDIMGIRVVGLDGDASVGAVRAVVRALPLLAVPLVRPLWAAAAVLVVCGLLLARPGRRSLTDVLASTTVVRYDRDREDPTARRPVGRHQRRRMAVDMALGDRHHGSAPTSAGQHVGSDR